MEARYEKLETWENLPVHTISWNQAVAIMRTGNQEIISANNSVTRAHRESMRIYTDLIPSASYYAYMNRSLEDLTRSWDSSSLYSNFNVNFFLPTLTQLPYRVYSNKVTAFSAVKSVEAAEREAVSKLYQMVRKRELALRLRELESAQPAEEGAKQGLEAESVKGDLEYYQAVAKVLGNASARWNILPETMPRLQWQDYRHRLDKLDSLVVLKFVLDLERSRMEQYSIALRYLPTLNTSLYSPSLFSSSGGTYQGTFLSSKDTKINLSLSYSLDTRLDVWTRFRDSQDRYRLAQKKVELEMREHKSKIDALKRSVDEYENWKGYMAKRMEFIRTTPAEDADSFLERNKALADMRRELIKQEQQAVDTEAALILEYGMPGLTPMKFE